MENKDAIKIKEVNGQDLSEADRKKLAGLTIGVGVGTVAATGATIGAVVNNVMSYAENNDADTGNTDEVTVSQDEISEESVSDDELVVISEEDIEVDEEAIVDSMEMQDIDSIESPAPEDLYLDDIYHDDDLLNDTIDDMMI